MVAGSHHLPAVVIALPAEIGMANVGEVGQQLGSAVEPGVRTGIADMVTTTFCDSSGISLLVRAHEQAATNGTELRLMVPALAVLRSLALVSIDQLPPIYPSLGTALAAGPQSRHE